MTTEVTVTQDDRLREAGARFLPIIEGLEANGMTLTDLLLGMDTVGYERIGAGGTDMRDMQPLERTTTVRRSRLFFQREPLVDRAINMWTEFCFAHPWSIQATDEQFQTVLDEVFAAEFNARVFGRGGQQEGSLALLTDGERPTVFYVGERIAVRDIDALEITDVLCNPEDKREPWYYVRSWVDEGSVRHTWVYRDWNFTDETGKPRTDTHPKLTTVNYPGQDVNLTPRPNEWMTIVKRPSIGQRGYPLFTSGLDWVRAHREFLRDRAALNAASAQYAWKGTVKGGQAAVTRLASSIEGPSPLTTADGLRQARAAAFITNEGADLEAMPGRSDGAGARNDERALRLMAAMPSGLPEHLLGDVSTGNLATAEALKPVLLNMFTAYQGVWMDFYEHTCNHIARWRGYTGDVTVDIDAPAIFPRNLIELAQVLSSAVVAFPVMRQSPEVLSLLLTEIGLNNVEELIAVLEPLMGEELGDADAEAVAESLRTLNQMRESSLRLMADA